MNMHTCGHHMMVTETSRTTNLRACFFYNTFLYWLANLLIGITFFILASFILYGRFRTN